MESRKITILEVLEATTGGTRRHLKDLVLGLDNTRFDVAVACAVKRDPAFQHDIKAMRDTGHRVTIVPMVRAIRPISDIKALFQLRRMLRDHPVDIVHTHSAKAGFLGRFAAAIAPGTPALVHTPHHFPFDMEVNRLARFFYLQLEKAAARQTDRIICVCPHEHASARARKLAPAEKLAVIENGLHTNELLPGQAAGATGNGKLRAELKISPEQTVIGVAGRFCRQKGQIYLLNAAPGIFRNIPDAVLVFVGGGKDYTLLRNRAERLGIINQCRFIEHQEELGAYYDLFDILAMPSLWEGMPYTLLEAMAAGVPVVAFETGGITDVISHGRNGLLVPPKDSRELAAAIGKLIADKPLRDKLRVEARQTIAAHYHVGQMLADTEKLYEEVSRKMVSIT